MRGRENAYFGLGSREAGMLLELLPRRAWFVATTLPRRTALHRNLFLSRREGSLARSTLSPRVISILRHDFALREAQLFWLTQRRT